MKIRFGGIGTLTATILLFVLPAAGQVQVLTSNQIAGVINLLNDVDFETPVANLTNPLRIGGVTFTDPASIALHQCTSPTCEPDPDNADGENMLLALTRGANISFAQPRRFVVLDLQGNDTNRIGFRITDARGKNRTVVVRAREFAPTLVGVSSPTGIRRIEVVR